MLRKESVPNLCHRRRSEVNEAILEHRVISPATVLFSLRRLFVSFELTANVNEESISSVIHWAVSYLGSLYGFGPIRVVSFVTWLPLLRVTMAR